MNTKNLMNGDWVYQAQFTDINDPTKGHGWKPVQVWMRPFDEDNFVDPIKLTSKILEKNGFVVTSDGFSLEINKELEIVIHNDECVDIWVAKPRDLKHLTYSLPYPNYVHELQHALRLCKIEKEIVL